VAGVVLLLAAGGVATAAVRDRTHTAGRVVGQPIQIPQAPAASASGSSTSTAGPATNPAPAPAPAPQPAPAAPGIISEAQAKQIALAQVPGATSIRIHLDYDDGRQTYEGEIIKGYTEYDFEIDAVTGVILEWDIDD
jgi:hypothetical protein